MKISVMCGNLGGSNRHSSHHNSHCNWVLLFTGIDEQIHHNNNYHHKKNNHRHKNNNPPANPAKMGYEKNKK